MYDYTPTREGKGPSLWLKNFKGYLQADAYDVLATFNQTSTAQIEQFLPDAWKQNQLKQLANLENQNPT